MDGAIVAAGDEQVTVESEGQAGGIDQRSDIRLHAVVRADLVERDGNALAARSAERDVDVAAGIDHRIRDRMQIVGDLKSHADGKGLALVLRLNNLQRVAGRIFRNAHNQAIAADKRKSGFRFTEAYDGAGSVARRETAAMDGDFAAGNGRSGKDAVNPWNAVLFCR